MRGLKTLEVLEGSFINMFFNRKIYDIKFVNNIKNELESKVVCFGDSITWGYFLSMQSSLNYPASLKKIILKKHPKSSANVINEGHNGWTSLDALNYVYKIIELKPDLVILMFGINDVLKSVDIKDYLMNMKRIIKLIKMFGSDVIVLSPTEINRKDDKILDLYSKKLLVVAERNGAKIIDLRKIMKKIFKVAGFEKKHLISIDTIHLKNSNYSLIADIIYKKIF